MQVVGRASTRASEESMTRAAVRAMKSVVLTSPNDTG